MKKLVLTTVVSALAAGAFAQGTVNWTAPASLVIVDTNSVTYFGTGASTGQVGGGVGPTVANTTTQYYYELLVSSTATSIPTLASLSSWLDTGLEGENGATGNGRLTFPNQSNQAVANNWASGVTNNVILVGWSGNLGTTYASAYANYLSKWATAGIANAYFGVSTETSAAAQVGNPGVTVFAAGLIDNPSTSPMILSEIPVVPEPTTLALAAIGGASMLLIRRKK